MEKKFKYKYIAIIAAVVLVAGVALVAGDSYLFQGRLGLSPKPIALMPGLYKNAARPPWVVSAVVSPVPSVIASTVTSDVPSQVGPSVVVSQVPSQVPSVVVSGVSSAVSVDKQTASKVDVNKLPLMTGDVLKSAAKKDMLSNPQKYVLSPVVKKSIIDMYMKTHRGR